MRRATWFVQAMEKRSVWNPGGFHLPKNGTLRSPHSWNFRRSAAESFTPWCPFSNIWMSGLVDAW